MTGKIIKIETALIARLPQAHGEVWEVGRRPQLIRVSSQAEAEALDATLTAAGIRLEVSAQLVVLEALVDEMATDLGGGARDYRTQAARAGEALSQEGLRELFRSAKAF